MAEEVSEAYRSSLEELTLNSKPVINALTMLAEENIEFAPQIVQIIEAHLRKAKTEHKLPVMYLIDSIIKNIGKNYLSLFRQNIVSNFCTVFEKGDEKVRMMLFKLRQTWSEVFSSQKLHAIDLRVQQLDPAWPVASPASRTSVHINPKFIENSSPSKATEEPATVAPVTPITPVATAAPAPKPDKNHESMQAEVMEKLKEKHQELLRLKQQKLELELLQTKARLDEQTRQLKQVQSQQTIKEQAEAKAVKNLPEPNLMNQSVPIQVNTQQQSRDPRLSGNIANSRDPRIYAKLAPNVGNNSTHVEQPAAKVVAPKTKTLSQINKDDDNRAAEKSRFKGNQSPSKVLVKDPEPKEPETKTKVKNSNSPAKKSKAGKSKDSSPKSKKNSNVAVKSSVPKIVDNKKNDSKKPADQSDKEAIVGLQFPSVKSRSRSPQGKKKKLEKITKKEKEEPKKLKENISMIGDVDLRTFPNAAPKRESDYSDNDKSNLEPPLKKPKGKSDLDALFGGQDRDYRSQVPHTNIGTPTNKKGWAKYKDEHADEYSTPRRPSISAEHSFAFGKEDTDLRMLPESEDKSRKNLESTVQMTVMVKNQEAIMKGAEEQLRLGQINEKQYEELQSNLGKVVKLQDERKKQLRVKDRQKNSTKKIMIDNKMREIRFENGCGIVTMDNHRDHLIYFKGNGRHVTINSQKIFLNFNGVRKNFHVSGQEHSVLLGGPTRELYVDDIPYECRFGGPPVGVTIDGKVYKAQLEGPPPDVDVRPLQNRDLSKAIRNDDPNKRLGQDNSSSHDDSFNQRRMDNSSHRQPPDFIRQKMIKDGSRWNEDVPSLGNSDRDDRLPRMPNQQPSQYPNNSKEIDQVKEWRRDPHGHRNNDLGRWSQPSRSNMPHRPKMHQSKDQTDFRSRGRSPPRHFHERQLKFNVPRLAGDNFHSRPDIRMDHQGSDDAPHNNWNRTDEPLGDETYRSDSRNSDSNRGRFRDSNGPARSRPYPQRTSKQRDKRGDSTSRGKGRKYGNQIPPLIPPQSQFSQKNFGPPEQNILATTHNANMLKSTIEKSGEPQPSLPQPSLPQLKVELLPQPPPNFVPMAPLNISSLFDKLVTTGIISKSDTGAGYNVGVQEKKDEEKPVVAEIKKEKETKSEDIIPAIELNSYALKKKYPGVIKLVYTGTKCESCGVRFTADNMDKYGHHLDWHFRSNRREKDGAKKANSRKWYYEVEDWIQFEEIEDLEERAQSYFEVQAAEEQGAKASETNIYSVPASADSTKNICTVCGEEFEQFWDEDEESWHLKDAIRVSERTFHPLCYEDSQKRDDKSFLGQSSASSHSTNVLPGLDLLEPEPEPESLETENTLTVKEEPKDVVVIKQEPVSDNEDAVSDDQPNFKDESTKSESDKVVVKQEPMDAESGNADDELPKNETAIKEEFSTTDEVNKNVDTPVLDEQQSEDNPPTPLIDEANNDPPTPLVDENLEESSRPEPERVRIAPQTGSAISLNLCKSTVDSGLQVPVKEKSPTKDIPASQPETEGEEEEMMLPPPDPRFAIQEPVLRGTELSGLCSIL